MNHSLVTAVRIRESSEQFDANCITKIEVVENNGERNPITLKIFLKGEKKPKEIAFPTKKKALKLYGEIWRQRRLDRGHVIEVGNLS